MPQISTSAPLQPAQTNAHNPPCHTHDCTQPTYPTSNCHPWSNLVNQVHPDSKQEHKHIRNSTASTSGPQTRVPGRAHHNCKQGMCSIATAVASDMSLLRQDARSYRWQGVNSCRLRCWVNSTTVHCSHIRGVVHVGLACSKSHKVRQLLIQNLHCCAKRNRK
jgi:hypothetical protein